VMMLISYIIHWRIMIQMNQSWKPIL